MTRILDDVRVLGLTRWIPGEYCTKMFADYGADLMTIEKPISRGYFRELTRFETGTHLHPGHPWQPSGVELRWDGAAPVLGQDNEYVCKELLGFSDAQYHALVAEGQIGIEYV